MAAGCGLGEYCSDGAFEDDDFEDACIFLELHMPRLLTKMRIDPRPLQSLFWYM